jgi:hypothetical protein
MTQTIIHAPCDPDYYVGDHWRDTARGVTTWNLNNQHEIPLLDPGDPYTLTFTCTVPKCYALISGNTVDGSGTHPIYGRDSCNIVFNAWVYGNVSNPGTVELNYTLNGHTDRLTRISGFAQHGATQAFDLANIAIYNDRGMNTLVIQNVSSSTIQVDHFKIYRTYKTCNPHADEGDYCTGEEHCDSETNTGTNGSWDDTRIDRPCNCDNGGRGFTQIQDNIHSGSLIEKQGGSLSWTFDFSSLSGGNYVTKSICLFNFNQVYPNSTDPNNLDVPLDAVLNGETINTYYLSKWNENNENKGLFASHDLATESIYDDDGSNTVTLINTGSVDVKMAEPIDIYRIFASSTPIGCCEQCETCQTCQDTCEVECQTCMTGCEATCVSCFTCATCYTACQGCYECQDCQHPCYVSCQHPCFVSCQTGCEVSCQDCQTTCEVECQTGCEVSCQVGCQVACQYCEGSCQTTCEVSCQTGCEVSCQTGCEVSCQTGCEVSCQTGCEVSCQTGCEVSCQTVCYISCQPCFICYTWYM